MTASAGRTLGRYRLERLIGRGGMAEVWEARDQTLGRRVAVKIILPNLAGETRFHERFLSEARSVAALEHEHVLPIYDFGEAEGEPYLVMPFLDSGSLAERLKSADPTPVQAIEWIRQLASALDAAHAAGVLHRDVKPANVMVGGGGRLLLADFGIAKSNQSADLTATGIALGTPAYMAPELARGEGATAASDRYALGVLAYELLCGRPPFIGDNALALLHQHLTTPVPAVVGVRPDLPEDLDPAFARILAKDPAERPPSCAALADEIAHAFGDGAGVIARPITLGHRAAIPVGPDDATLAAPVSHAPPTPATRSLGRPPATPASAQARGASGAATAGSTPRATTMTGDFAPTAALRGSVAGAPATPNAKRRRFTLVAVVALASAVVVLALCWLFFADRESLGGRQETAVAEAAPGAGTVEGDAAQAPGQQAGLEARDSPPPPSRDAVAEAPPSAAVAPASGASSPASTAKSSNPPREAAIGSDRAAPANANAAAAPSDRTASAPGAGAGAAATGSGAPAVPAADIDSDSTPSHTGDHGAAGRWSVPPAEAFAIFGLVADAWRQGRFRPQLFTEIEQRSASMRTAASTPGVELLTLWIAGGKALIAGDVETARAAVAEFQALDNPPEWATLLPGRFLAKHPGPPPDWQVALFWADPRNEARPLVEAAAKAAPNDRNLQLARAVIDHLDGKHAEAALAAVALEPQMRQVRRARVVVERFAGDQLLWSGDAPTAISWYKRLLTAPDRTEIGAVLRTLSQEGGPPLVARACNAGFTPACDTARQHQAVRGRRAKPN